MNHEQYNKAICDLLLQARRLSQDLAKLRAGLGELLSMNATAWARDRYEKAPKDAERRMVIWEVDPDTGSRSIIELFEANSHKALVAHAKEQGYVERPGELEITFELVKNELVKKSR